MQTYETTIIVDSLLKGEDQETLVKKIENFVANNGGEILSVENWGKRRLAYEINKKQYGNYYLILFKAESTLTKLLEREYRLEEAILRHLTLKADPKVLADKEEQTAAKPTETKEEVSETEAVHESKSDQEESGEEVDADKDAVEQ